jgi:hypothetical protein
MTLYLRRAAPAAPRHRVSSGIQPHLREALLDGRVRNRNFAHR